MQPPAGSQVSRVPAQRTPPDQLTPPPATPAPERPRRRLRTVLIVVAGVLAVLCVAAVVAGIVLYNRAATPDRSAPDVAVVSYLQATLVSRDQSRAALFTCDGSLPSVDGFRAEMERREQELDVGLSVNIENVVVSTSGPTHARVTATIRRSATVDGVQQSLTDAWQFEVEDRNGWRVCAGAPVS
ncbi:hypothetical protein GA0070609_5516 [Micromonospora echinaurantiaca]|uniref:Mce-associated membrane protein n=1 Tax=Micromonospora echinaurantiaca TaxID=47857 RepID=A0A1C5K681_9ACTN|nr:hypothetical protein GA0070609_5516 [Micromonospora echinaurantiaca]